MTDEKKIFDLKENNSKNEAIKNIMSNDGSMNNLGGIHIEKKHKRSHTSEKTYRSFKKKSGSKKKKMKKERESRTKQSKKKSKKSKKKRKKHSSKTKKEEDSCSEGEVRLPKKKSRK